MDIIDSKISEHISSIGRLWRNSQANPKSSEMIITAWDNLINEWAEDKKLPLIIRRSREPRGHEYTHKSGRKIIISDNTVAIWVSYNVINKNILTLEEIKNIMENDELPIAFAFKSGEASGAKLTKTLGKYRILGWTVCHIEPVGLNSREKITDIDISILVDHFKKYLSPGNMFLLPNRIAGLGEIQEFIEEQR